jgi:uracil-DNA glycosylase family protein
MSPRAPSLAALRREAAECRRCPLYARATQTVFGEGRRGGIMLVGEQPGDVEDREGRPFVGPAGRLLRELLEEAAIPGAAVYVTNAVKHFKWRPSGKRRIHDKPNWSEVRACGHWLGLELESVRPALVVCLGATAAQALFGRSARVGQLRGQRLRLESGLPALVTIHPSAVLRADADRETRRSELLADLELAREMLLSLSSAGKSVA